MAKKPTDDAPAYELDTATEEVAPPTTIDRLLAGIEALVQLQMAQAKSGTALSGNSDELMVKLTDALERVSANQLKGSEAIAQSYRQVHRPSNEVVHLRSAFNPRGNPLLLTDYDMPKLRCDCWVPRPEQVNDNMLTREEVELLNILVECPGTYVITRIDDTKVKLNVKMDYGVDDVTPTRLILQHDTAFNNEYFRLLPSLHAQLRQMLRQNSDEKIRARERLVLTMDEEATLISAGKLSVAA